MISDMEITPVPSDHRLPDTAAHSTAESAGEDDWDHGPLPPFISTATPASRTEQSTGTHNSIVRNDLAQTCIGPYEIVRELGRGGMGVVYEAIERPLDRRVAIKVLPFSSASDPQLIDRLHHEARIVARLDHPNIVKVYGSGEIEGVHYIAFQLVEGCSLNAVNANVSADRDSTSSRQASRWEWLAKLGRDAASALQHAHENGIIHRDIKPSNLLLDRSGKVWVADFGLARATGLSQLTATGDLLGTLRYMSPEQAIGQRGIVDARTDLYSLGTMLYELATSEPVFDSEDHAALLRKILCDLPRPLHKVAPGIPRDLATIIGKAMAKFPADRYATAATLVADFDRFLEHRPIVAVPPTVWDWVRYYAGRNRIPLTIGLASVFIMLTGWNLVSRQHGKSLQEKIDQLGEARQESTRRQWETLLTLAERGRLTLTPGRRQTSLRAMNEASRIFPSSELTEANRLRLRDTMIATLAIPMDLERQSTIEFAGTVYSVAMDEEFQHAIRCRPGTSLIEQYNASQGRFPALPTRQLETGRFEAPYYWVAPIGHAAVISGPAVDPPDLPVWQSSLWNLERGESLTQLPPAATVAWSQDGKWLALLGADSRMRVVDTATGTELANWQTEQPIVNFTWCPGEMVLALIRENQIVRVQADSGVILDQQPSPPDVVQIEWTSDKRFCVLKDQAKRVVVWNYEKHREHVVLDGPPVRQLVVPTHGVLIATEPLLGEMTLWNIKSGQSWLSVPGRAVAFHRDGTLLATCENRSLSTWSIVRSQIYRSYQPMLHEYQEIYDAGVSPNGRWLVVTGDLGLTLIDMLNDTEQSIPRQGTRSGQFVTTGDQTSLVLSDSQVSVQEFPFDNATGTLGTPQQLFPRNARPVWGVGHAQITAGGDWLAVVDAVTRPVVLQRSTGRVFELEARPDLWYASASPDGRWAVAGTYQGHGLDLWDVSTGKIVREIWNVAINSRCEFSPDGRWLAVSTSHEFRVFDTQDWSVVYSRFSTDAYYTTAPLAFTPDGQLLLMSENQSDLQLLATGTWTRVATLQGPDKGVLGQTRFSSDGRWLVRTSGAEVHVWNMGALRTELRHVGVDWSNIPAP